MIKIVSFVSAALVATSVAAERPNVLVVIADDLMKQVGLYGNPQFKTPHLNALAKESLRFDRAYCQYPLCGPSRASLMTGMYPTTTGVTWNQGGKSTVVHKRVKAIGGTTIPLHFRNNGYITLGGGKLYHDGVIPTNEAAKADFEVILHAPGKDGKKVKDPKDKTKKRDLMTYASPYGVYEHKDGAVVKKAMDWLKGYKVSKQNKPFFMCVGLKKPHSPFAAPKKFWDLYEREKMLPSDVKAPAGILTKYSLSGPSALLSVHPDTEKYTGETLPLEKAKEMVHGYAACVSYMDFLVGDLVKSLKSNGLYENTIIVFTSDHGYKLGEYQRWAKYTLHEKDATVPLLVRVPQVTKGGQSKAVVGLIDLFPTLTELCGVAQPPKTDGLSFKKSLADPKFSRRSHIHTFVTRAGKDGVQPAYGMSVYHQSGFRYTCYSTDGIATFPSSDKSVVSRELWDHYASANSALSVENLAGKEKEKAAELEKLCRPKN